MIKNKYIFLITLQAFFVLGVFSGFHKQADAMIIRAGESYNLEDSATLNDDLYIFGEDLNVFGTTTGDVLAGGSRIKQNGDIGQDGLFVGANVSVVGDVDGDLRTVGNVVFVNGTIKEDTVIVGNDVELGENSVIKGDLLVVADHFSFKGEVDGLLKVYANIAEIKGVAKGPVDISAKDAVSVVGDATLGNGLTYKSPRKAFISETASINGEVKYNQSSEVSKSLENKNIFRFVLYVFMVVVSAVAFVFFFPNESDKLTNAIINENKIVNIIKAFLLLIVWPILAFFLMFTIVGFIPGLLLLLSYVIVLFLSFVLSSVVVGVLLARLFKKFDERLNFAWVSFGAVILSLIGVIPFFGFIIKFIFLLMSFHAMSSLIFGKMRFKKDISSK
jgi:hypothetical protein